MVAKRRILKHCDWNVFSLFKSSNIRRYLFYSTWLEGERLSLPEKRWTRNIWFSNPFRMTQSFTHGNILGMKDQKYGEICFKISTQNGKANIPYAHSGSSDCKDRVIDPWTKWRRKIYWLFMPFALVLFNTSWRSDAFGPWFSLSYLDLLLLLGSLQIKISSSFSSSI